MQSKADCDAQGVSLLTEPFYPTILVDTHLPLVPLATEDSWLTAPAGPQRRRVYNNRQDSDEYQEESVRTLLCISKDIICKFPPNYSERYLHNFVLF